MTILTDITSNCKALDEEFNVLDIKDIELIKQVVLQPTSFCNLNCTYCYLPNRSSRKQMSTEIAVQALGWVFESGLAASNLEVRWHAGEPLAVPISFYREAIAEIKRITPNDIAISHSLQTNGTLVSESWCRFFQEEQIRVGLSLDGPEFIHDRFRLTRGGKGTHELAMRAVDMFNIHNVPFSVIAVITSEAMAYPDKMYEFFAGIGAISIGFNVEESEGINTSKTLQQSGILEQYHSFLKRIYERQKDGRVKIREIEDIRNAILFGEGERQSLMAIPFGIVSVDCEGNLSTFSPELLGMQHPVYGSFVLGNVMDDSAKRIWRSRKLHQLATDITNGVDMCIKSCPYFFLCGGGAPSNKLYENGSFSSTATFYCQTKFQIVTDIVLEAIEVETN